MDWIISASANKMKASPLPNASPILNAMRIRCSSPLCLFSAESFILLRRLHKYLLHHSIARASKKTSLALLPRRCASSSARAAPLLPPIPLSPPPSSSSSHMVAQRLGLRAGASKRYERPEFLSRLRYHRCTASHLTLLRLTSSPPNLLAMPCIT